MGDSVQTSTLLKTGLIVFARHHGVWTTKEISDETTMNIRCVNKHAANVAVNATVTRLLLPLDTMDLARLSVHVRSNRSYFRLDSLDADETFEDVLKGILLEMSLPVFEDEVEEQQQQSPPKLEEQARAPVPMEVDGGAVASDCEPDRASGGSSVVGMSLSPASMTSSAALSLRHKRHIGYAGSDEEHLMGWGVSIGGSSVRSSPGLRRDYVDHMQGPTDDFAVAVVDLA
jgi:hypothetical protein